MNKKYTIQTKKPLSYDDSGFCFIKFVSSHTFLINNQEVGKEIASSNDKNTNCHIKNIFFDQIQGIILFWIGKQFKSQKNKDNDNSKCRQWHHSLQYMEQ